MYDLFSFATNLRADRFSPRTYSSGWTLLGLLFLSPCHARQPQSPVFAHFHHRQLLSYLYEYNSECHHCQFLGDSVELSSHHLCPFQQGKHHKVQACGSSDFSHAPPFNFTTECTAQSLKFTHVRLSTITVVNGSKCPATKLCTFV